MPYIKGQPSLPGFFGKPIVHTLVKTRLIGGPYIKMPHFFAVISHMYTIGAVLGRAQKGTILHLFKMVSMPEGEGEYLDFMQTEAKKRLTAYTVEKGKEPKNFIEFIWWKELEEAVGLSMEECFEALRNKDRRITKAFSEKWSLNKFEFDIKIYFVEGMAFGSIYPKKTEMLYRNAYEKKDTEAWSKVDESGLHIAEKPSMPSLEEQEDIILQMLAAYTSTYYPELLGSLKLKPYLSSLDNLQSEE